MFCQWSSGLVISPEFYEWVSGVCLNLIITIRYLFFKELQPPPSVQSEIFRMPFKVLWLSSHILSQKARKTAESHQVSLYAINFFFRAACLQSSVETSM